MGCQQTYVRKVYSHIFSHTGLWLALSSRPPGGQQATFDLLAKGEEGDETMFTLGIGGPAQQGALVARPPAESEFAIHCVRRCSPATKGHGKLSPG